MRAVTIVIALAVAVSCRGLLGIEEAVIDPGNPADDGGVDANEEPPDGPALVPDGMTDPPCDATACGAVGGTCTSNVCLIIHTSSSQANCPNGMACHVRCLNGDDCKSGVKCNAATSCQVECAGATSCQGTVDCGNAATCTVRCTGSAACQSNPSVKCQTSTCDVTCDGSGTCTGQIGVDPAGTCVAHCCNGGCSGGTNTCTVDAVCT